MQEFDFMIMARNQKDIMAVRKGTAKERSMEPKSKQHEHMGRPIGSSKGPAKEREANDRPAASTPLSGKSAYSRLEQCSSSPCHLFPDRQTPSVPANNGSRVVPQTQMRLIVIPKHSAGSRNMLSGAKKAPETHQ